MPAKVSSFIHVRRLKWITQTFGPLTPFQTRLLSEACEIRPLPEPSGADESCPDCPLGKCVRYDPNDPRSCPWDRATGYVGDYKEGHPKRDVPAKVVPMRTRRSD